MDVPPELHCYTGIDSISDIHPSVYKRHFLHTKRQCVMPMGSAAVVVVVVEAGA